MTTPQPPHNTEAEQAVIGALLIDASKVAPVEALGLAPLDFYRRALGVVYKAILDVRHEGREVDVVTVSDMLERRRLKDGRSHLDVIGGSAELARIVSETTTSIYAEHYAGIVADHAFRRRLIEAAGAVAGLAYNWDDTRAALQQQASETLNGALAVAPPDSHLYGTDDALAQYLGNQIVRQDRLASDPDAWVKTGWPGLDKMLVCVEPGMMQVVAARPGVGKTTYLECVAEYNAQHGHAVAFYHLELSHQTMLDRRMARHSRVSYSELRRGYNGPEVAQATDRIRQWQHNLTYVHCPGWGAERIAADMARLYGEGRADVVVVDYLQKVAYPEAKGVNEASLIGRVVGTLKDASERLGVPVFLGSQVTRDVKHRENKMPQLTDLFGSGLIEAYTNQVITLHREPNDEERDVEPTALEVQKNTMGRMGTLGLLHLAGQFAFVEAYQGAGQDSGWEAEEFNVAEGLY